MKNNFTVATLKYFPSTNSEEPNSTSPKSKFKKPLTPSFDKRIILGAIECVEFVYSFKSIFISLNLLAPLEGHLKQDQPYALLKKLEFPLATTERNSTNGETTNFISDSPRVLSISSCTFCVSHKIGQKSSYL